MVNSIFDKNFIEVGTSLPQQMLDPIVGITFNEDNKINGYIYGSNKDDLSIFERPILADKELIDYIIEENKKYEVLYVGNKYNITLTIKDKDLFKEADPVIIEKEEDPEVASLKQRVAELEALITNISLTLTKHILRY